jgi:hypothetical protein
MGNTPSAPADAATCRVKIRAIGGAHYFELGKLWLRDLKLAPVGVPERVVDNQVAEYPVDGHLNYTLGTTLSSGRFVGYGQEKESLLVRKTTRITGSGRNLSPFAPRKQRSTHATFAERKATLFSPILSLSPPVHAPLAALQLVDLQRLRAVDLIAV